MSKKLWRVTNGYVGYSTVHVLVVAETEERAKALAAQRYKQDSDEMARKGYTPYPPGYYDIRKMQAELLCDDLTHEWVSDVFD